MLQDKRITLIVSGGIAAYKSCETARALMRAGAHVRVVMTEHATKFVTPLTFEALTGSPVLTTEWQPGPKGPMPHIDVNRESDLLLVMPATANLIAKAARGIADDLASTLICARRTPIAFVPAMNAAMWRNPATRRNIEFLRREGALIFGPAEGLQACGDMGAGRMLEPAEVVDMMEMVFSPKHLAGKCVLITAGPTYEAIDPVRGITNRSSGLQGFSIARAARDFGAEVTLIAGPTHLTEPVGVKRIDVVSAREMDEAVQIELDRQRFDLFVSVAAVADWRPGAVSEKKIKKDPAGGILLSDLNWVENPDILARVGERPDKPLTIGFAAETAEGASLTAFAREKCFRKHAAFIVANDARQALESKANCIQLVSLTSAIPFGPADKFACAQFILTEAAKQLSGNAGGTAAPSEK
ncbi:bifunctional phosphopantothenoylcysteine decarboxylase/phosphopantothenate--cysteine ligase CoaBC [Sutterella wadsworthensis]|uniref:bifunctional phosphopantothenoylcysteine decarboxylase/phosphopantothenate--cysteine ligase CoaBC n=1 Tax=Sutterella wadsworthensis TaxID=40545 RepID=UPI003967CDB9